MRKTKQVLTIYLRKEVTLFKLSSEQKHTSRDFHLWRLLSLFADAVLSMSMRDLGDRLFKSMQIVFLGSYSILSWPPRKMKASLVFMVDYMLSKTVSTVQKMLFLWSVLVMLVIVSLMLYSAFYSAFVPTAEISRPVHLEFR